MYKYSINDLPNAFNDYFTKRSDIHGYKTRHVYDLKTKNIFPTILFERLVPFFGILLIKK